MARTSFHLLAFIRFKGNFSLASSLHSSSESKFKNVTSLNDALNLFDEMTHRQPLPSVVKFTQLLNAVTKMKHFSCALTLFKQMCLLGLPLDQYPTSIAIRCCCRLHRINDAFALLGFCFRRNVVTNASVFNALLDGLVLEDRVVDAERLFKKIIRHKLCEPTVVTYSTMIKGLCKFGNNDIAVGLLRLMDERGCKPDVVVYGNIIDSLCKDKMVDDAFKLFNEMVFEKNIAPDVVTYTSLIRGLCILGRWDEVSKMLKEMEDVNITPDLQTFSVLVDAFCKEGKVDEAQAVIDVMVERGEVPNIVTYNALLDGYCLRGEMSKAKAVFDSLTSKGLIPNVITYNTLLNGYCKKSNIEEAMNLFREVTRKGLKPNAVTYGTMIQGLFRVGRCKDARKLFDETRERGQIVCGEFTLGIVLDGLCNNHHFEDALSLFQSVGNSKLNSNIIMYNILIEGANKCGKPDIARALFHDLTVKGLQPNVQTYNIMVNGLCREGQLKEAKRMFLKMHESDCPPDNVTYCVLLQGYLKNQHYDDVEMLLQEMDGRSYTLNASTVSTLIDKIAAGSVPRSMLKLIGRLVPKDLLVPPP